MGTLCLFWPPQSPSLLKAGLPEAHGGLDSSAPSSTLTGLGPMSPCIVALHCFSLPQFPHLEGSLHFLDLLSPELTPCQPGGGGGQTLKYVKGSILVRTMEFTGDVSNEGLGGSSLTVKLLSFLGKPWCSEHISTMLSHTRPKEINGEQLAGLLLCPCLCRHTPALGSTADGGGGAKARPSQMA